MEAVESLITSASMAIAPVIDSTQFNAFDLRTPFSDTIALAMAGISPDSHPSTEVGSSYSSPGALSRLSPVPALRKVDSASRFCNLYYMDLYQLLSAQMPPQAATAIADYLDRYKATRETTSALRVTQIRPFSSQYRPWPIVSWREGDDIDALALFKIEGEGSPASCLMFYGNERCWAADGKRWKTSYVAWSVTSIEHIRELFLAAAHIGGIITPAEYLFSEESVPPSAEEYTPKLRHE